MDVVGFLTEAWLLFLLSLLVSAIAFPLVVLSSFFYSWMVAKNPRSPKVLFMAVATLVGVFIALVLLELYVGITIPELASSFQPS